MKRLAFSFLLLQFFCACSDNDKQDAASENDLDAARNFLRAALDGKWSQARTYLLQDTVNTQILDRYEEKYQQRTDNEVKRGYREASIRTYDTRKLNDSTEVVIYSNSYTNQKDSLKLVRTNGKWLVDLKYSQMQQRGYTDHAEQYSFGGTGWRRRKHTALSLPTLAEF